MVEHSGIGTYIRGLMEGMASLPEAELRPRFVFVGPEKKLREYPVFETLGEFFDWDAPLYSLREQFSFPNIKDADAYHFPHYNVPLKLEGRWFVSIHDVIHLAFPGALDPFQRICARILMKHAANRAECVFTGSQTARRDLQKYLRLGSRTVRVIPHAVSETWQLLPDDEAAMLRKKSGLPYNYVLAVGSHKLHKHLEHLVQAFSRWPQRTAQGLTLVLCGVDESHLASFTRKVMSCNCDLFMLPYIPYQELAAVYQGARAVIFPSLYEGFGLPVLEAQRMGAPLIASNRTSIPEVAGEGALYFDPMSDVDLHRQLDAALHDQTIRDQIVAEGHKNEQRFHWVESARQVVRTYNACL